MYEQNIFANPPFVNNVTILNTQLSNPTAGTPSISLSPKTLHGTPLPYRTPYTQQWSFDVQHQLGRNLILDAGYYGSKGTHLPGLSISMKRLPERSLPRDCCRRERS